MRASGRVSVSKAARLAGVHYNTMLRYAKHALADKPTKVKDVKQDPRNRYITIALCEVVTLRSTRRTSW